MNYMHIASIVFAALGLGTILAAFVGLISSAVGLVIGLASVVLTVLAMIEGDGLAGDRLAERYGINTGRRF